MNKNISRLKRFFVLLLITLYGFASGCNLSNTVPQKIRDDAIEAFENEPVMEESNVNSVGIYLDATPSMEGYLGLHEKGTKYYPEASQEQVIDYRKYVPLTVYAMSLQQIGLIADANFRNINYYRADTTLWKTEENFLKTEEDNPAPAAEAGFYTNSYYKGCDMVEEYADYYSQEYHCPAISYAIENALKEDFSIIITDLYENEANDDELLKKLKEIKTNRKEASVAILGLKSQYAGVVYDLTGNQKESYGMPGKTEKIDESSIKYRPFYIILIGNRDIVELFISKFYKAVESQKLQIEKVIFQDTKVYGVDYEDYAGYRSHKFNYIYEKDIDIYNEDSITKMKLVQMSRKELADSETIYLLYDITSDSLAGYLSTEKTKKEELIDKIDGEEFKGRIIDNWYVEQTPILSYVTDEDRFQDNNLKEAMKISNIYWLEDRNQLMLECDLDKNKVDSGIYKFSGKIFCRSTSDKNENWISEWNSPVFEFDGEKTKNLSIYYDAINETFTPEDKSIVCFAFYFTI